MDAFDADVLIYAAVPRHPLGRRVAALFPDRAMDSDMPPAGIGSLMLLPEMLVKPIREGAEAEVAALAGLLARLNLLPLDADTAALAVALGAAYRLRAADSIHLATAMQAGADRFITNNRRDFPKAIAEISVTYPEDLEDPEDRAGR
jgi:predicted nucleic acid-binding protein